MAAKHGWLCAVCLCVGCELTQPLETPRTATVSSNPFGLQAESRSAKASYQAADESLATQVDGVARKLIGANPQIGLKATLFATIGKAPQPEVFHTGPHMVYVTEGLVQRCKTEADLAAVLAVELGKIVAEREAAASPDMRNPERLPPIDLPIGNNPNLVHQFEMAKFEKERPRTRRTTLPRPDPNQLARGYLEKAGYQPSDLDTVQPLLQAAQSNVTLERQFKGTITPNAWTP